MAFLQLDRECWRAAEHPTLVVPGLWGPGTVCVTVAEEQLHVTVTGWKGQ